MLNNFILQNNRNMILAVNEPIHKLNILTTNIAITVNQDNNEIKIATNQAVINSNLFDLISTSLTSIGDVQYFDSSLKAIITPMI
jgi:hypothetical protein